MAAHLQLPKKNDILIAVMGVTGSGKSSFIQNVTGRNDVGIGHGLCSETSEVRSYTAFLNGKAIVLVDTPGFDDTFEADEEIVERIAEWLSQTYQSKRLLNGILYMHRIDAPRLAGSSARSLRMLKEICGRDAYKNIVLATTCWDLVDGSDGDEREKELLNEDRFWKSLIDAGATTFRMPRDVEARKELLLSMGTKGEAILKIQTEMVDEGKSFEDTTAATELDRAMAELKLEHAEKLRQAEAHARLQIAIAEADRIFREEEARAIHNLRLEEEQRRINDQRVVLERRARQRLAEVEREQEHILQRRRLEAAEQQRAHDALVQAEMEATRQAAARVREKESETRMHRCRAQSQEVKNQFEFLKMGDESSLVRVNYRTHSVLVRYCDNCLNPIGSREFYTCKICSGGDFDICGPCFGDGLYCRNVDHELTRCLESEKLGNCRRALFPDESARLNCDRCAKPIRGIYLHCCVCDGDNFDMCVTCALQGRQCRGGLQHTLWVGVTPILVASNSSPGLS